MNEIWKDIKFEQNGILYDYTGLYQISNKGRVKNLKKNIILKQNIRGSRENNKYFFIVLLKNHISKKYSTHRLVAKMFIPNPNNLPQINHIDENKLNNNANNLEWCNRSYNRKFSINKGSIIYKTGENCKISKLNGNEVRWILKNYNKEHNGNKKENNLSLNQIAKIFNVSKKAILNIVHRKTYKDTDLSLPIKYKFFVYSDVHGHFDELQDALKINGFDINNPLHKLIDLSDTFDRGRQSSNLYEWYKSLDKDKIIVLQGNHFPMFIELLQGIPNMFNFIYNGTNTTIDDFYHQTRSFEMFLITNQNEYMYQEDAFADYIKIVSKSINKEYPELLEWLKSLPNFYETKNYIFTHGMINGSCNDWHNPPEGWNKLTWAKPEDFNNPIVNTDKTVVVGHINCGLLRSLYGYDENDNSIFTRPDGKVIGLDACTILTKKINVLIIEDEY